MEAGGPSCLLGTLGAPGSGASPGVLGGSGAAGVPLFGVGAGAGGPLEGWGGLGGPAGKPWKVRRG